MMTRACPMAALVSARRDDRLGPREIASLERHLPTCADCRHFARDLELMGELAAGAAVTSRPLEVARRRAVLLRDSAAPLKASDRRPLIAIGSSLVAVALVAVFGLSPGRRSASLPIAAEQDAAQASDTRVQATEGTRYERSLSNDVDLVQLWAGTLDVSVAPRTSQQRFVVRTADAEVDVRAGRLHVDADAAHLTAVEVEVGAVEVRPRGGERVVLSDGGSWRAPTAPDPALAAPAPPPRGSSVRPNPPSSASASPPPAPQGDARDFTDAIERMERGDIDGAIVHFNAFRRDHPRDPRSEDAAYLVAIGLQRAGRRKDAVAAARSYLAEYPEGTHRDHANMIAGAP